MGVLQFKKKNKERMKKGAKADRMNVPSPFLFIYIFNFYVRWCCLALWGWLRGVVVCSEILSFIFIINKEEVSGWWWGV